MTDEHGRALHGNDGLDELALRLEDQRPIPAAAFRGALRQQLLARRSEGLSAPGRIRLAIAAYGTMGCLLLGIALLGLTGIGPLGAG